MANLVRRSVLKSRCLLSRTSTTKQTSAPQLPPSRIIQFVPPKSPIPMQTRLIQTTATKFHSNDKNGVNVCWNCDAPVDCVFDVTQFNCPKCEVLCAPNPDMNYFELMDMKQSFKMDLKKLSQRYKDLQRILHPDKFVNKTEEEKKISEDWSPFVNNAYQTLHDPLKRALYLLQLHGDPMLEGNEQSLLDTNFLAEIMELNEELVDADTAADVSGIAEAVREILQRQYNDVAKEFEAGNIRNAKVVVAKMQYYHNVKDKIKEKEGALGVVH